jgi:predicted  nucleic acid-binding Zn-ribbon protein
VEQEVVVSGTPRWIPITLVAAFILIGALAYGHYNDRQQMVKNSSDAQQQNQVLAAELDKTNSRIASLQGQLQVTLDKLGMTQQDLAHARQLAQEIGQQQKTSDARLRSQIGQVQQETTAKIGAVSSALTGTQTDVAATKKDLADTKTALQHTVGDLGVQSGLIAHNHEEVEELRRLGERNIFEFNLAKQKNPQRVGPIQVVVKKLDPKHYRYTMNVMADDKSIEKKDKTSGEPVQFYVQGARAPYEIVVFNVNKDNMTGYLSTPKDAAGGTGAAASTPAKP